MVVGPASVLPYRRTNYPTWCRWKLIDATLHYPRPLSRPQLPRNHTEASKINTSKFAAAHLPKRLGDLLAPYLRLMPGIWSTEAGPYWPWAWTDGPDPAEDWKWYSFSPGKGIFFEQRPKAGLYKLVFRRQKGFERWQQIFHVYPELTEYPTKDLSAKHPTREELREFAGRMDDLVILSHCEDAFASNIERVIGSDARVKTVLIGWEGRKRPFLILELVVGIVNSAGPAKPRLAANISPAIEKANEFCSEYVRLSGELTIFASASKLLMRIAKVIVAR